MSNSSPHDIYLNYGFEEAQKTANFLRTLTEHRPVLGIICGSGLGNLANKLQQPVFTIDYTDIPNFPRSTVMGHAGKLVFGTLGGKEVMLMKGRIHMYEGNTSYKASFPVRVFNAFGIKTVLITNASGGLNRSFKIGDLMVIKDHLDLVGLAGRGPLVGHNDDRLGPRFPPMSRAYDQKLINLCKESAKELGMENILHEGTYCFQGGPCYETCAESKMLLTMGGDVTGMSTVPEVVVATHCGMSVLGLSLVTNMCAMQTDHKMADGAEVIEMGEKRSEDVQKLISRIVEKIKFK